MAGHLNIKLLVASVHNLRVLLIFFDFILFISLFVQLAGAGIHFNVVLPKKVSCTCGNFHSPSIQLPVS